MKPYIHFNPKQTASYIADKTTIRLLLSLKAALNFQVDHFDISSAYLHEKCRYILPVYVKQHPRFNSTLKHPGRGGILIKNLYGNPSGGYYYLTGGKNAKTTILLPERARPLPILQVYQPYIIHIYCPHQRRLPRHGHRRMSCR